MYCTVHIYASYAPRNCLNTQKRALNVRKKTNKFNESMKRNKKTQSENFIAIFLVVVLFY